MFCLRQIEVTALYQIIKNKDEVFVCLSARGSAEVYQRLWTGK
jgi:hypothetical protein